MLGPSLRSLTPFPPPPPRETQTFVVSVPCLYRYIVVLLFYKASDLSNTPRNFSCGCSVVVPVFIGTYIFYLYTLYIEQHIKTYNNIQYTNGIQKKVFRLILICIPFKLSRFYSFYYRDLNVPMLILVLKRTTSVLKLFNYM